MPPGLRQLDGVCMVWFDLDQTLCDHEHDSRRALLGVRRMDPRWLTISEDRWCQEFRIANAAVWDEHLRRGLCTWQEMRIERFRRLLRTFGLSTDRVEWLAQRYLDAYLQHTTPMPDALDTLAELGARGWPMGVITDASRDTQLRKLRQCGLTAHVGRLITPDQTGVFKPHAGVFRYAADRSGLAPSAHVYVGDSWESDILGARRADWSAVWVNRHGTEGSADEGEGIVRIDSIRELPSVLPERPRA